MPPLSSNKAEPTLALKPRGDITRSPKQGYQLPHKRTHVLQKFKKKTFASTEALSVQYAMVFYCLYCFFSFDKLGR